MNIKELEGRLAQPFTPGKECGVAKVDDPDWQNISFVVPPPPPKKLQQKNLPYELMGEALKVLCSLPQAKQMNELDKLVNYLFVRREVVQSSRLEGTWSTIDHALTPGEIADEKDGRNEHQAVRSYANLLEEAVQKTIKKKESVFTVDFVREIQKRIVENDPKSKGIAGKLRTPGQPGSIVVIGGSFRKEDSTYNPAPPTQVKRCLEATLGWFRDTELAQLGDAGSGLTLPMRLAIGHAHFEAVHPFTDGNGRTGRALWPLQIVCSGFMPLYLSGYVEEHKDDYGNALQTAQKKLDYSKIIEFVCNAIIESDHEAKKSKAAIAELENIWQERGKFRAKSAAQRTLKILLTKPIISAETIAKELNVSAPASANAIKTLVEQKIIRFRKHEKRRKIYAAEELVYILARPFGSDIDLALEKAQLVLEAKK